MGRILSQRTFQPTQAIKIECVSENTSYGFRHLATVYKNGVRVGFGKATYYNRSWEKFEFQSAMIQAVKGADLTPQEKADVLKWLEGDRTDWSGFHSAGALMKLGEIMGSTPKEKNILKEKALRSSFENRGLDMPSDWATLDEETKSARLGAVSDLLIGAGRKEQKKKLKKQIKGNGELNVAKETQVWN